MSVSKQIDNLIQRTQRLDDYWLDADYSAPQNHIQEYLIRHRLIEAWIKLYHKTQGEDQVCVWSNLKHLGIPKRILEALDAEFKMYGAKTE